MNITANDAIQIPLAQLMNENSKNATGSKASSFQNILQEGESQEVVAVENGEETLLSEAPLNDDSDVVVLSIKVAQENIENMSYLNEDGDDEENIEIEMLFSELEIELPRELTPKDEVELMTMMLHSFEETTKEFFSNEKSIEEVEFDENDFGKVLLKNVLTDLKGFLEKAGLSESISENSVNYKKTGFTIEVSQENKGFSLLDFNEEFFSGELEGGKTQKNLIDRMLAGLKKDSFFDSELNATDQNGLPLNKDVEKVSDALLKKIMSLLDSFKNLGNKGNEGSTNSNDLSGLKGLGDDHLKNELSTKIWNQFKATLLDDKSFNAVNESSIEMNYGKKSDDGKTESWISLAFRRPADAIVKNTNAHSSKNNNLDSKKIGMNVSDEKLNFDLEKFETISFENYQENPESKEEGSKRNTFFKQEPEQEVKAKIEGNTSETSFVKPFNASFNSLMSNSVNPTQSVAPTSLDQATQKSVLVQLEAQLSRMTNQGSKELTLNLNPENLGKIEIKLAMVQDQLRVSLKVENEQVKHTLQNQLGHLKDGLELQNVNLEKAEVSTFSENHRHNNQSMQGEMGKGNSTGKRESKKKSDTPDSKDETENNESIEHRKDLGYNTMELTA